MKPYPLIQLPGLDSIEAEKDEVLVNPDKVTYSIGGKSHARGGTKMFAEAGSYILSDHLELDKEVVKEISGRNKKMSPAKLSKLHSTQKWDEILSSKDKRYDDLAKQTAALMFDKEAARQETIYLAQEQLKQKRGMKNDLGPARSRKLFQSGGELPYELSPDEAFMLDNPGMVSPAVQAQQLTNLRKPAFTVNTGRTLGYSEMVDGIRTQYYRPFANDPYFDIAPNTLRSGNMTEKERTILGQRQQRLSSLQQQFPGENGVIIDKEYAKYLKAADEIEKDDFLDKFVIGPDGKEIPLSTATEAQIDAARGFRYFNKRTGKDDLVDYRDRQNQGFDPVLSYVLPPDKLDTSNLPIPRGTVSRNAPLPNPKTVSVEDTAGQTAKGIDWQSIVNGTQIGLLAADMAATRTKPPYYDYRPSELAYTRFEPLNTKQQERAFNIARESIENSNLPQQVKTAQLANMYGSMAEGVNQMDLANYQAKLANDNRNVQTFNVARNNDIANEQNANQRYAQEAERRNFVASAQRQKDLSSALNIWDQHVSNRRDTRLVNQLSQNYDYDFNTQQVEYTPGQGVRPSPNRLEGYKQNQGIDPRYLNAEGMRAYYNR